LACGGGVVDFGGGVVEEVAVGGHDFGDEYVFPFCDRRVSTMV
jgi:hypothetical protein